MSDKKWGHDELLTDLAQHLSKPDRMIWMDMQMGPSGSARPDIYSMLKSYNDPRPITYEIKVSISDFRSDITKGKWQSYLPFSSGIYFCVPVGMITKNDIPVSCGLMVRGDDGWRSLRAPTLQKVTLSEKVMLKLLIDGVNRANMQNRQKEINTYLINKKIREKIGNDVADVINDRDRMLRDAKWVLDDAERNAKQIMVIAENHLEREKSRTIEQNKIANESYEILRQLLELREGCGKWEIINAVKEFKEANLADTRLRDVEDTLSRSIKMLSAAQIKVSKALGE